MSSSEENNVSKDDAEKKGGFSPSERFLLVFAIVFFATFVWAYFDLQASKVVSGYEETITEIHFGSVARLATGTSMVEWEEAKNDIGRDILKHDVKIDRNSFDKLNAYTKETYSVDIVEHAPDFPERISSYELYSYALAVKKAKEELTSKSMGWD